MNPRTIIIAALAALFTTTAAEAQQCLNIQPGTVIINHRQGMLYGRNFYARVACTWNVPILVYWRGGAMCLGRSFYGRNGFGQPFSCRVRGFGRR